jgi:long-subunit acyl-CoA synthetase (AMP-forming)
MKLCGAHQPDQEEVQVDKFIMLDSLIKTALPIPIQGLPPPYYRNKLMYIYTSGTTGLPKAAVLLNSR